MIASHVLTLRRHQVTPGLCLEHPNEPHFDGECLIHLDEQIESRAQAVFRFGALREDEYAEEWAG